MTLQIPRGEHVPTADQRVVMYDVSWDDYEAMLAIRGERPQPRMAYLDGALELMTTSWDHERIKSHIGPIVETYMVEIGVEFGGYGNWTQRKPDAEHGAGLEADECYQLGKDQRPTRWPDLAIEVIWTSGGIDKLEIYRRLGVREVWFWEDGEIQVHVLVGEAYEARDRSQWFADLDLALVCRLAELPTVSEAIREARAAFAKK